MDLVQLPPRQSQKANNKIIPPLPTEFDAPTAPPLIGCVETFGKLQLEMVRAHAHEGLWEALIERLAIMNDEPAITVECVKQAMPALHSLHPLQSTLKRQ